MSLANFWVSKCSKIYDKSIIMFLDLIPLHALQVCFRVYDKSINSFLMTFFGKNLVFFEVLKGYKNKSKNATLDFRDFSVGQERANKQFLFRPKLAQIKYTKICLYFPSKTKNWINN